MRSLILFCSKLRLYLTEIPPILLLIVAIKFNNKLETFLKLYPLIILMSAAIIFIAVYFARFIVIKNEEIKTAGFFASREKVLIAKGKTIAITILEKRRIRVDVLELNSDSSVYAWLKSEAPREVRMFSEKANGNIGTVRKIIEFYGVERDEASLAIENDEYAFEDENLKLSSLKTTDGEKQIRIFFKETI